MPESRSKHSRRVWIGGISILFFAGLLTIFLSAGPGTSSCGTVTQVNVNGQKVTAKVVKLSKNEVELTFYFENRATAYRICEDPGFSGCDWVQLPAPRPALKIKYKLSEGSGIKTVYFQARNGGEMAEVVKLDFEIA